jgi:hypothetical protein
MRHIVAERRRRYGAKDAMSRLKVENNIVPPAVLNEIVDALSSIQFGSIEIQIHNGVVVQLERKEKKRWDKPNRSTIEWAETR